MATVRLKTYQNDNSEHEDLIHPAQEIDWEKPPVCEVRSPGHSLHRCTMWASHMFLSKGGRALVNNLNSFLVDEVRISLRLSEKLPPAFVSDQTFYTVKQWRCEISTLAYRGQDSR